MSDEKKNQKARAKQKEVIVVGVGRFGSSLARELYQQGNSVLVIDKSEERIQEMVGTITHAVTGDATREDVLNELGIEHYDIAVVAIGYEISESIMVTVLLKSLGVPTIIARAHSKLHGNTLERVGCDRVVHVEEEMGENLASDLLIPLSEDRIDLGGNIAVNLWTYNSEKTQSKNNSTKTGEATIESLGFVNDQDVEVLVVRRENEVIFNPDITYVLQNGDKLLIAGDENSTAKLIDQATKGSN